MADNDGIDEHDETQGPKQLRDALDKANKKVTDLEAELGKLRDKDRSRTVSDLLVEKGLPAKVAKLLPQDVEPTAESLDKWLTEYGDVFNIKASDDADGADGSADDGGNTDPGNDPAAQAAHERVATATSGAAPSGKADDILAKMSQAKTPQELDEVLGIKR